MTRSEAKELLPIITAFAEGRAIQWRMSPKKGWESYVENLSFENGPNCYRIKPEPKYRPWKPEEVPVGALIKFKEWLGGRSVILTCSSDSGDTTCLTMFHPSTEGQRFKKSLIDTLADCEHSLDHGKTWLPCGVLES